MLEGCVQCFPSNGVPVNVDWSVFCESFPDFSSLVVESVVNSKLLFQVLDLVVRASGGNDLEAVGFGKLAYNAMRFSSMRPAASLQSGGAYLPTVPAAADT